MYGDPAVQAHLDEVVQRWRADGPLDDLCKLVDDVWNVNRKRQDPDLGDDAQLLGLQCHRNILNGAKPLVGQVHDVEADGAQTLEIRFNGQVMHTGKVGPRDPSWSPYSIDWGSSPVRQRAAEANTRVFASAAGTLFEELKDGAFSRRSCDPRGLQYLHLAWQGLEEGTRVFVGFPWVGGLPWLAVAEVSDSGSGTGGVPTPADVPPSTLPDHDGMSLPEVSVKRRSVSRAHGDGADAGGSS